MANQPTGPAAQTGRFTYRNVAFFGAFVLLWLESAILITSTVWENYVPPPQWAEPILEERGLLLGVAAAIALLLSLLWAWNPTGMARYGTLSSGVLGFAAAIYNLKLEPDDLPLGLAMLGLVSPFFVIMLPELRWPESMTHWIAILSNVMFIAISAMLIILGIEPITITVINAGVQGLSDLVIVSVAMAISFTTGIIVAQLAIQVAVQVVGGWAWPRSLWLWICQRWPRKQMTRAERRRRGQQRRR